MCGIIGYVGSKPVIPILLAGLSRLEYRGYDSAGIAVVTGGELKLFRRAGKVEDLAHQLAEHELPAQVGIGHTRWATHGPPTVENAHPHVDCRGKIAVVHNGIIENFRDLKARLIAHGHTFKSDTDSEVIAHLVEEHDHGDLRAAVAAAVRELAGAFAIAVVSADDPTRVVAARRGSPLVVGTGSDGGYVCSDIPAIIGRVKQVMFLADGEIADVRRDGIDVLTQSGEKVSRAPQPITTDPLAIQKGGYKHFMLKEIHEQPRAVGETLRENLLPGGAEFSALDRITAGIDHVYLVACGTAYHAGLVAEYQWEELLGIPVHAVIASEFRYRKMPVGPHTLVVAVSQSGETIDTLMAARHAQTQGARVLALVNTVNSALARTADATVYTRAGIEIGVAATKTFTAQLALLSLIGTHLAQRGSVPTADQLDQVTAALRLLPGRLAEVLAAESAVRQLAERFYTARDFLFLGRGPLYPIALEGALKLKEVSYIHAEGYPAGEMKHGPIALIDERMPVVVLLNSNFMYDKVISNIEEVKARNGIVIVLTDRPADTAVRERADHIISIPAADPIVIPALYAVPLQLLAYYIAVRRGTDVDQPRNLAKTVTVE